MCGRSVWSWSRRVGLPSAMLVLVNAGLATAQVAGPPMPARSALSPSADPVVWRAQAQERPALQGAPAPDGRLPDGRQDADFRAGSEQPPGVTSIAIETGKTLFLGIGPPGTLIDLTEGRQLIGVTTVDTRGRWSLLVESSLPAGDHRIAASSRDPARARVLPGPDVLVSIPEGFAGGVVQVQRASVGTESVMPRAPQRRADEAATNGRENFAEVMSSPEWSRVAQATQGPAPQGQATQGKSGAPAALTEAPGGATRVPKPDNTIFTPVVEWFDRAGKDYYEKVVKQLADPRPLATQPAQRTPETATGKGPVRTLQTESSQPVQRPASEQTRPAPASRELTFLDDVQGWLSRASHDYREGIVKKLAQLDKQPTPEPQSRPQPGAPLKTAAPRDAAADQKLAEQREAEALRRADEERRRAEMRRAEEQKRELASRAPAIVSPPVQPGGVAREPGKTEAAEANSVEAKRLEEELAVARRADEAREQQRRQQEAKRIEDERRIAEQTKAEESRRTQETAASEAQRRVQEQQAALAREDAKRQQEAAQRAEETKRAQETAAARDAQRKALEDARRVEQQRQTAASQKAAEDAARRNREVALLPTEPSRGQERVTPAPSRLPNGFKSEEDARRAMVEASRAPKVQDEAPQRERSAKTQPAPARESAPSTERRRPDGFRSDAEYRQAMIDASNAPKDTGGRSAKETSAPRTTAPVPAKGVALVEAERKAQEMLRAEGRKVAELKSERERRISDRRRAEELRLAAAAPKVIEEGSALRAPAPDRGERSGLGAGGNIPASQKGDRPAAECPAAGRRVSLPGTYIVKSGDTLWKIAERFYDDGESYQRIVRANRGRVPNPNLIEPCQKLVLPRASR